MNAEQKTILEALEAAHHELATLHGLRVCDEWTPEDTWGINVTPTIKKLKEAKRLLCSGKNHSLCAAGNKTLKEKPIN